MYFVLVQILAEKDVCVQKRRKLQKLLMKKEQELELRKIKDFVPKNKWVLLCQSMQCHF